MAKIGSFTKNHPLRFEVRPQSPLAYAARSFIMDIKEFTDVSGRKRIFEFRAFPVPTGFECEAVEIVDGEPRGMRLAVLGKEDEADILRRRLEEKIKRSLSTRHLEYHAESHTWGTCGDIIRGQIKWNPQHEGQVPLIIVDGKEVAWEEFGRIMMTYEGFQFILKFVDPADDVFELE